MSEEFHKPALFPGALFTAFQGGDDPAAISRVAHETAHALLARVREDPDPTIVERLVAYTDANGIDAVAELWSRASARSLVVAGAPLPTGPADIVALADQILRGVFGGDFAVALERAAAFCRVTASGCTSVADDAEATNPDRASELTRRALRLSTTAVEFTNCARLWRSHSLD